MDKLFLTILNMSFTGAFVIAVICLVRLPLKKAPKIISYYFWAAAGFRLAFPFTLESIFSLIPFNAQPIPLDIGVQAVPRINTGISYVNSSISSVLPSAIPTASITPLQIWTEIGSYLWLIGVAAMLIYGIVSFAVLKRNMDGAVCVEKNIFEIDTIQSPFVLGLFFPKIYLPPGLSVREREYILLHEKTHIRRHDHIIKMLAYFILCLHWFNPFVWLAFILMGADMEMSCDEHVLKKTGGDTKKDYSLSLLSLATKRRIIGSSPLAFGEGGVQRRIKNILNFKKTSYWIVAAAVVLAVGLSVGFALNRMDNKLPSVPNVYVSDLYGAEAEFQKFGFQWNDGVADAIAPWQGEYSANNILTVLPSELIGVIIPANRGADVIGNLYLPDGTLITENCVFEENKSFFVETAIIPGVYICEIVVTYSEPYLKAGYGLKVVVSETARTDALQSSWMPLPKLPINYSKEQAIADGVYVNIHNSEIYNQEVVDKFYNDVFSGTSAAFMRVMQYTTEGDAIITDYQYYKNLSNFNVTTDTRRDKFGTQGITAVTYKYLVPYDRPGDRVPTYLLSNEQSIYTTDNELIEGLCNIPSPSDGKIRTHPLDERR